jgi:hypothetical protein
MIAFTMLAESKWRPPLSVQYTLVTRSYTVTAWSPDRPRSAPEIAVDSWDSSERYSGGPMQMPTWIGVCGTVVNAAACIIVPAAAVPAAPVDARAADVVVDPVAAFSVFVVAVLPDAAGAAVLAPAAPALTAAPVVAAVPALSADLRRVVAEAFAADAARPAARPRIVGAIALAAAGVAPAPTPAKTMLAVSAAEPATSDLIPMGTFAPICFFNVAPAQ